MNNEIKQIIDSIEKEIQKNKRLHSPNEDPRYFGVTQEQIGYYSLIYHFSYADIDDFLIECKRRGIPVYL